MGGKCVGLALIGQRPSTAHVKSVRGRQGWHERRIVWPPLNVLGFNCGRCITLDAGLPPSFVQEKRLDRDQRILSLRAVGMVQFTQRSVEHFFRQPHR